MFDMCIYILYTVRAAAITLNTLSEGMNNRSNNLLRKTYTPNYGGHLTGPRCEENLRSIKAAVESMEESVALKATESTQN